MKKLKLTYILKIEDEETGEVLLDNSLEYRANSFPALHGAVRSVVATISYGAGVTAYTPEIADKVAESLKEGRLATK